MVEEKEVKIEKEVNESKKKAEEVKTDISENANEKKIESGSAPINSKNKSMRVGSAPINSKNKSMRVGSAPTNNKNKSVKVEPEVAKVEKKLKKEKKGEIKVELEREYIVPLKKGVLNVPHYRRAKKAIRILKEFMVRHMQIRDRDLRKVKIDIYLNNELWFRGIKKPANKIKVKAKKIDGIVYVELADVPDFVKFAMARDKKRSTVAEKAKVKTPKHAEKEVKSESEKTEEKEDVKSGAEADAKMEKAAVKTQKHTAQGKHAKKSMPVRKSLKK